MSADLIEPLRSLSAHARRERDAAMARLVQAQLAHRAALAQGEQLATYRDEYKLRWSARFTQGTSTLVLQCYQGFAGRLEQAIAHQIHAVRQAELREQQARATLVRLEQRAAAVDKLIERRLAEQVLKHRRFEQHASDESAGRRHAARRSVESTH